jgi:predicted ferric reductase
MLLLFHVLFSLHFELFLWIEILWLFRTCILYRDILLIRVITKLPNSEQSYKGKVKTHNYINRQNQSTTGKLWKRNDPDLVQAFLKKWWVESDFKASNLPLSLRLKVSGCHYNSIYNNTWTKQVKQLSKQHQTQWSKCQRHFYVTHW